MIHKKYIEPLITLLRKEKILKNDDEEYLFRVMLIRTYSKAVGLRIPRVEYEDVPVEVSQRLINEHIGKLDKGSPDKERILWLSREAKPILLKIRNLNEEGTPFGRTHFEKWSSWPPIRKRIRTPRKPKI